MNQKKPLALLSAVVLLLSLAACGGGAEGGPGGNGAGGQTQISQSGGPEAAGGPGPGEGTAGTEAAAGSADADKAPGEGAPEADPAEPSQLPEPLPEPIEPITEEGPNMLKMEITVGGQTFPATLTDNAAARALLELLPMTLDMSELNGNEKYYYLDGSLPADPGRPAGIHAGDIMLYGDSCLVLFYKSFSTSYSYTVLGRVDDPEGFSKAVGSGGVQVSLGKAE